MPVKLFFAPVEVQHGRGIVIDGKNSRIDAVFSTIQFVDRVEDCDFVVLPKSIAKVSWAQQAIAEAKKFAKHHQKSLIIFYYGDHSYAEHVPEVIAFKWSAYSRDKLPTEVIHPVFVNDLTRERALSWRKKSSRPSVSFCGFAKLPNYQTALKYHADNFSLNIRSYFQGNPDLRAHKRGLYFRRKSMRILSADPRIDTRFIARSAYFNQIQAPSETLRTEYLDNILDSDFVLAPRGDANISTRFFEALSLGRIPLLIDTDCVLPLERHVEYQSFVLSVPHTEMHTLPERILDLYNSFTDQTFIDMQKRAREAYVRYFEAGAFFNTVFPLLKNGGPEIL